MWSSFLDQIQQRIDDAAELLGDEETEETGVVDKRGDSEEHSYHQPADVGSSSPESVNASVAPLAAKANATVDAARGWDEEEADEMPPSAIQEALSATPPIAAEAELPKLPTDETGVANTHCEERVEEPSSTTETPPQELYAASAGDSVPVFAFDSSPPDPQEAESIRMTGVAAVPTTAPTGVTTPVGQFSTQVSAAPMGDAASSSSPPVSPPAPHLLEEATGPLEDGGDTLSEEGDTNEGSAGVAGSQTLPGGPAEQVQRSPAASSHEVGAAPGVPPAPANSGDVAQLLRFQQQLAEEMESVANLQRHNTSLRDRVALLEEELANATARLAKTAGSEEQISLLIEKLGKEKERHKAAAGERAALEEHVQDLEDELEEYRVKEQGWIGGSEQQRQNESAAQQRIAQLEKDLRARDALADDLNSKLRDTMHQNGVLQRQVEELKTSYSTQLNTVKETNSDTVDQLRQEVEQLRASLQNLSTEYDTRTSELEREVQQANVRAQQAEARFNDVELGSLNAMQDLRNELEDSQRSITTWKAEAHKTRSEYTELLDLYALLKRSRAAVEADLRDRLSAESTTAAGLRKAIRGWEDRFQSVQEALRAAQAEIEDQQRIIMQLEAANQKLKTVTVLAANQSRNEQPAGSPASTGGSSLEASLAASPLSTRQASRAAAAGVPINPFANRERPAWSDSTDRKTRERLEQEVLRQAAELERLRAVSSEDVSWKENYLRLQAEHDLLLQLYGQLEDDVTALRSSISPTKAPAKASPSIPPTNDSAATSNSPT